MELVDGAERTIGNDPGSTVIHSSLDQRIMRGDNRALRVGRLDAASHTGAKALLCFRQLPIGQTDPLTRYCHLLLRGREIEHRLPGLSFNFVDEIALPDLLDRDPDALLLRTILAA